MELHISNRSQARIRVAMQGPSGSGKTYSSLLLAFGICKNWKRIAVIDTENQSADLYSHLGEYNVLSLKPPYSPERYIEAIQICENAGMDVIIIDSISHEWEGDGGILDIHAQMAGNSFTNWSKITPRHNSLVQKILSSNKHIIATVRSKQDYILTEKNGKTIPEKVGMKGVQRDGLEYDFTIVFELDMSNHANCSKDRSQLFNSKTLFKIDESVGEKISSWCKAAELISDDEIRAMIRSCKTIDDLTKLYNEKPIIRKLNAEIEFRANVIRGLVEEIPSLKFSQNGRA